MNNKKLVKVADDINEYVAPAAGLSNLLVSELVSMECASERLSLKELVHIADALRLLCRKSDQLADLLQNEIEDDRS